MRRSILTPGKDCPMPSACVNCATGRTSWNAFTVIAAARFACAGARDAESARGGAAHQPRWLLVGRQLSARLFGQERTRDLPSGTGRVDRLGRLLIVVLLLVLVGGSWMIVGNTQLSAVQTAIPSWVRARVRAGYLLTFQGRHGGRRPPLGRGRGRAGNSGVALFERRQCDPHIDSPAAFAGANRR
jgi:transmembrane secretion effector